MTDRSADAGRLVVVATPIGNLGDLSPRAAEALDRADVVAAEDTRRSRVLLAHAGVRTPMVSYHDHNTGARIPELIGRIEGGDTVALITDAGTPGLSDPGQELVRAALARDLHVEAVPGPAAALHALVLSGLAMDRFAFEGFLPRKPGPRHRRLQDLATDPRTLIFYVAPHRAAADLDALAQVFGDRPAALARELTKLHEQVVRAGLATLAARVAEEGVRGEVTLVVAGASESTPAPPPSSELVGRVRELVATGLPRKAAIAEVARATQLPKRVVYQAVADAGGGSAPAR